MEIKSYINDLLYQYECVTIPEFGSFLTRKIPAKISFDGTFTPPKKEVSFNSLLKTNDGILAKHIAQKTNSNYESILKLINKKTIKWIEKLEVESLNFPGIGEMKLNNHGKIEFLPSNEINFYKNSFGLYSFKKNPLVNISYNKKHDQIMENSNNDDLLFTPESKNKKRKMQYIKYSAIGLLIIVLIGSVYFFSDNYLSNQKLKEIEIAQKKIKSNVQKATFDIGKLSKVELNVNSNNSNKVSNLSSNEKYFSVIAGSFRSINNAENKLNSLIKEGYKAEMAKKSSEGFHRVAYGRFISKKKAINLLIFVKYTLQEEAWFLEE
tara:strand:+ start:2495 stop:3463 length:969 start_codon:yes stop_codon:yes gene_type:complete